MKRALLYLVCLLFAISTHGEQVCYIVQSRTTVSESGTTPRNTTATYVQGGNKKCQLTAGNKATLTLDGWDGLRINNLTLSMHSNQKAGAGSLTVKVGSATVWQIADQSFASDDWFGAYSSDYVGISRLFNQAVAVGSGEQIIIEIEATQNSLYIESFTIDYLATPAEPVTVSFSTRLAPIDPITETIAGAGIVLPQGQDKEPDWHFLGWTETEVQATTYRPLFFSAGTRYYPLNNCTLYALYAKGEEPGTLTLRQDISYSNNDYAIVDTREKKKATGSTISNKLPADDVKTLNTLDDYHYSISPNEIANDDYYYISFYQDSTALIYHLVNQEYISPGNADSRLLGAVSSQEPWRYRVLSDSTIIFYHIFNGKTRVLFPSYIANDNATFFVAELISLSTYRERGMALFPRYTQEKVIYSSNPTLTSLSSISSPRWYRQANTIINPDNTLIRFYHPSGNLLMQSNKSCITLPQHRLIIITDSYHVLKIVRTQD